MHTITITIYDEESELSEIQKCLTVCLRSQYQGWCSLTHSVFSNPLTHSLQLSWFCPGQHDQLGVFLQSERSPVWFLVRAHAWVVGQVPGWGACERQAINVSLSHRCFSPSLSPSLPLFEENKQKSFLKIRKINCHTFLKFASFYRYVITSFIWLMVSAEVKPSFLLCWSERCTETLWLRKACNV